VVDGGVQCWGYNHWGQLGNNSTTDSDAPVQVSGLTSGVTSASAGGVHTCAVVNGGVQCWGAGIGNGTGSDSAVPVPVTGL